jgi:hypothetical protein
MWAYSGLSQTDLATAAELHYDRLRVILGKTSRGSKGVAIEELWAIADACQVPRWFAEGWDAAPSKANGQITKLESEVKLLRAGLVRLVAGDLQRTRELLGLDETDRPEEPPASAQ